MYLPMLATTWAKPFDDPDWWFELKWDGYRCIAAGDTGGNRLTSRRGLDLADRFPQVAALDLPAGWVLDGEVVVPDDEGRPNFSLLQAGGNPLYVVFDVLAGPDEELIGLPLEERRRRLGDLALAPPVVIPQPVLGQGTALYDAVVSQGLEGVVAKRAGSTYSPGRRSPDWRKVAARRTLRAVVGGWLPGEGGRSSTFGSLLVGLWDDGELRWIGAVGSGFTDAQLGPITSALAGLERRTAAFGNTAGIPSGARWVEPGIVVRVEYKEWTRDGRLRAPVFKGVEPPGESALWSEEGPAGSG